LEHSAGGQNRRGHTESIAAAIWLSYLRGLTELADRNTWAAVLLVSAMATMPCSRRRSEPTNC
jgi:hypothetical protein